MQLYSAIEARSHEESNIEESMGKFGLEERRNFDS